MAKFRKPQTRKQGLKILGYGEDGSGKSVFGLTFPKIAIQDTESKLGVYENNPKYNKNLVGICDSSNYYDALDLLEDVIKNPKAYSTYITDSETNMYDDMQVSCMEVEEERARKKGNNVDDQTISMRGYGKIKLNNARLRNLKAQASANGVTIISVAHKKDITKDVNGKQVKIGEEPELKKGCKHDYDIVLRFFKEKDVITGLYKFFAEVEKDTTETYPVGTKLENVTYENWKEYIEGNQQHENVETAYDKTLKDNIDGMKKEAEDFDTIVTEFKALYKELSKDADKKSTIVKLMKDKGVEKYNDPANAEQLKEVIKEMKNM